MTEPGPDCPCLHCRSIPRGEQMRWTDHNWWDELEKDRTADKRAVRVSLILIAALLTGAFAPWHLLPWAAR